MEEMRLDQLAARAGVASTTVRLYQSKGLLPPPRLDGRTGYYDEGHLARLRLIARLQDAGFSLAGIAHLLEAWTSGRDVADVVDLAGEVSDFLSTAVPVTLSASELLTRLPLGDLDAVLLERAVSLGLLEYVDGEQFRVPDERFLDVGGELVRLGVPAEVVLDEWQHLAELTDTVAQRFIGLVEHHVLPGHDIDDVVALVGRFRTLATTVVAAALDRSIVAAAAERLGHEDVLT